MVLVPYTEEEPTPEDAHPNLRVHPQLTQPKKATPDALRAIGPSAERLARSESLEAHGLSVTARLRKLND